MNNISVNKQLALLKAKIISFGVDFGDITFNDLCDYKTKKKFIRPIVRNGEVFDESKRNEVIPSELIINVKDNLSLVKIRHNPASPIKAQKKDSGVILNFTEENIECYATYVKEAKILNESIQIGNEEYKVKDFLSIVGLDRISILLFDGCSNWNTGTPCKFCDMHPKEKNTRVIIPSTNELFAKNLDVDVWWDNRKELLFAGVQAAYNKIICNGNIGPHYHTFIMAGSLPKSSDTWKFIIELVSHIEKSMVGDIIINAQPHSKIEELIILKKMGVKQIQYNIEVFGESLYHDICMSKIPYKLLMEKLAEAVKVFGRGNVRSNFVLGLQPIDEVFEGARTLSQMGVVPDYSIFQPKKCTAFENHSTASLNDIILCSEFLCDLYIKNGFKPIFCNFSSRSSIMNEMYYAYEEN